MRVSRIDEGSGSTLHYQEFDVGETTPEDAHKVALHVCEGAVDLEDARLLLEALGLHGEVPKPINVGKGACPECGNFLVKRALPKHRRTQHGVEAA